MANPIDRSEFSFEDLRHSPEWRPLPAYKIWLQNDASVPLMHVVRSVMQLMRFCRDEATHKMWQAHHFGRSALLVTHLERAELYLEQFAERGLKVTMEALT